MIDLLFGWINKPRVLYTIFDEIAMVSEISIVVFIAIILWIKISDWRRRK